MSKIRKRFNQSAILRHLKTKCERCGKGIPEVDLSVHHKNGKSYDDDWKNVRIYCITCHRIVEGRDKKDRDRR